MDPSAFSYGSAQPSLPTPAPPPRALPFAYRDSFSSKHGSEQPPPTFDSHGGMMLEDSASPKYRQEWGSTRELPTSQLQAYPESFMPPYEHYAPGSWQTSSAWPEAEESLPVRNVPVTPSTQLVSRMSGGGRGGGGGGGGGGAGLEQLERAMKLLKTTVHSSSILRHSEIPTASVYQGGGEGVPGNTYSRSVLTGQEDLHTALHKIELELRDCSKNMLDFCVETETDMHMFAAM
eukprot:767424-Hanusia_phi.AAC.7